MEWHFWLLAVGFLFFFTGFTVGGLAQGFSWNLQVPFLDVVKAIEPWSLLRALGAAIMLCGLYVFGYNILRTAMGSQPQTAPAVAAAGGAR
jgi:cytochrome c oxidase cbb3-type subunit 1